MKINWFWPAVIVVGVGAAVLAKPKASKPARKPLPDQGSINGFEYFVVHTQGATKASPWIVFFHGRGGTPQGVQNWVSEVVDFPAHVVIPKGKNKLGNNAAWWLERAADEDQAKLAASMTVVAEDLKPFLKRLPKRPTLAGHSQGAMLASALAAKHPGLVKNAVVAAAWLPLSLQTSKTAPVVVVHGMDDTIIPYGRTADWVQNTEGVSLLSVPNVGHPFAGLQDDFAVELELAS